MSPDQMRDQALAAVVATGEELRRAVKREHEANYDRPMEKVDAIRRIMNIGDNPLNGKAHSASSAEQFVESDIGYAKACQAVTDAVLTRMKAEQNFYLAKLDAEYATRRAAQLQEVIGI